MSAEYIESLIRQKFKSFSTSKGKNGLEYVVACMFCGKKGKLYLNPQRGMFICYRCGEQGSMERILGKIARGQTASTAVEPPKPLPTNVASPGDLEELTQLPDNHPARLYLRHRRFSAEELNDVFGVRYCQAGNRFAGGIFNTTNTLVFPLWFDGAIIGWQARLLYTPDELTPAQCEALGFPKDEEGDYIKPPKYWTSPGLQKGRVLFNYDWARRSELAVVCEGPFDAAAVGRCAVATLGKGIATGQRNLLKSYWKAVIILLDPGDADEEMYSLRLNMMGTVESVVSVDLKGYKDAGETPRGEIWRQIGESATQQGVDILKYRFLV